MPKISELAMGGPLTGDELIPVVQTGVTNQITMDQVAVFVASGTEDSPFIDGSDIYTTLTAAIAALPTLGGKITIPAGHYYSSSTILINKYVWLEGVSSGETASNTGATRIEFPINTTGILIQGDAASGTIISNLDIKATNGGTSGVGVHLRNRAEVRDCRIGDFGGIGIHVEGETPYNNVNGWQVKRCFIVLTGSHGLYVNGADANAGLAEMVDVASCGGWGIFDSSFLGNTYVACQVDACTSGAYKAEDANARNVFVGCYSEGGQPGSSIADPSMVFGGNHSAGFVGANPFFILDGRLRAFSILGDEGTYPPTFVFGDTGSSTDSAIAFYSSLPSSFPLSIGLWDETKGTIDIRWNYTGKIVSFTVGGGTGTKYKDLAGSDIDREEMILHHGFWAPVGSNKFAHQFASATGSTSSPSAVDLGDSYADTAVGTKAKFKLYNDGAGSVYGIGITLDNFNFHTVDAATFTWRFNDVTKLTLTKTALAFVGSIKSTGPTSGIGYATGAGGTITQGTSRTTGVQVDTVCGAITLFSAAGSATPATFTVTNSTVAATDTVVVCQKSGTDLYHLNVTAVAAGSFNLTFFTTGGTTTEQPVFNFSVVKAVTS